ncbi:hypothetical protein BST61_g5769 [Cercospora zeina]
MPQASAIDRSNRSCCCKVSTQKLAELEQRVEAIEKCVSDLQAIPRPSLGSPQQPHPRDVPEPQAGKAAASQSSSSAIASSSLRASDDRITIPNLRREMERLKKVVASHSHSQRAESSASSSRQADFEIVDGGTEAENGKADEPPVTALPPPPWPFRVMYTRRPNLADGTG